jgi:hypothetical protein
VNIRRFSLLGMLLLSILACQSGSTDTTGTPTTSEAPPTTVETAETPDPGSVGRVEDMPAECVDALREYLRAIEPIVEDVDFQSTTMSDFEALGEELEGATEGFEERTESCPDLDVSTAESFNLIREFAESEAPGTVAYFTFIQEFAASFEGAGGASGNCETDIAAFQEFVDRGGSMSDLTASEVAEASTLLSSIGANCSTDRFIEWSEQEDVAAWIEGNG